MNDKSIKIQFELSWVFVFQVILIILVLGPYL